MSEHSEIDCNDLQDDISELRSELTGIIDDIKDDIEELKDRLAGIKVKKVSSQREDPMDELKNKFLPNDVMKSYYDRLSIIAKEKYDRYEKLYFIYLKEVFDLVMLLMKYQTRFLQVKEKMTTKDLDEITLKLSISYYDYTTNYTFFLFKVQKNENFIEEEKEERQKKVNYTIKILEDILSKYASA
jgi:hypothetical protein